MRQAVYGFKYWNTKHIGIPNILKFCFPMGQKHKGRHFVLFSNGLEQGKTAPAASIDHFMYKQNCSNNNIYLQNIQHLKTPDPCPPFTSPSFPLRMHHAPPRHPLVPACQTMTHSVATYTQAHRLGHYFWLSGILISLQSSNVSFH